MFQPGFEDADTSVVAAVPFYGVYAWTNRDGTGRADMVPFLAEQVMKVPVDQSPEAWDQASPMSWVTEDVDQAEMITKIVMIPLSTGD